jgi:hypothetical protein
MLIATSDAAGVGSSAVPIVACFDAELVLRTSKKMMPLRTMAKPRRKTMSHI